MLSQNDAVSNPWKSVLVGLAVLLVGCASGSRQFAHPALDWQSDGAAEGKASAAAPALDLRTPAPAPARIGSETFNETWVPLNRWCKANGLPIPTLRSAAPLPLYALTATGGVFLVRAGSQIATWDGLELRLGFAPQLIDNQPFVHALDIRNNLRPLMAAPQISLSSSNRTIVVDPGHGGEDGGTISVMSQHCEKEFTLDWARRLQELLAARGWRSLLTRSNDTELALSNRVSFAAANKADFFVSLHFNSAGANGAEAGLETYCLTPPGMPSTVTREFGDDPSQVFPNNAFDAQNLQLALRVHRELMKINGTHDRGVRRARYLSVLRGQMRPAILIEGGYLSNPHEAQLIGTSTYRQKLAEAVATALSNGDEETAARDVPPAGEVRSADVQSASAQIQKQPLEIRIQERGEKIGNGRSH